MTGQDLTGYLVGRGRMSVEVVEECPLDPEIGREYRNADTGEVVRIVRTTRSGDDLLVRMADGDWWSWMFFRVNFVPIDEAPAASGGETA